MNGKDSEYVELGSTGLTLENGTIKNTKKPLAEEDLRDENLLCPYCKQPWAKCTCVPDEWHH